MNIYLVGGAVRDQLLQHPYTERDWVVVGATPDELLAQGYQQVGKDFPVFLHPKSKEEYALARTERKSGQGYHGFICDFGVDVTLEEDLERRDLTINAMAMDDNNTLIDPYGGQQDLQQRRLRHVSSAFAEDPLRVLRVARFAARYAHLGFSVAPETLELMQKMSHGGELRTLTPERVWVELNKALNTRTPSAFFKVLTSCEAIPALFPEWETSLDPASLQKLDEAAGEGATLEIRFALCCLNLETGTCEQLCKRLRASNQARDLALLGTELLPLSDTLSASELLTLLEKLDYLRRPQRLRDFLSLASLAQGHSRQFDKIARAADTLSTIKAEALVKQGMKGPALGQALREQRLQALTDLLA